MRRPAGVAVAPSRPAPAVPHCSLAFWLAPLLLWFIAAQAIDVPFTVLFESRNICISVFYGMIDGAVCKFASTYFYA